MNLQLEGRVVFFATNNINKFNEARKVLGEYGIAAGMLRVKNLEVQSDSLEEIARASVADAFERCHLPIIVEDAGLFIEALSGFPGPYAAYVYKTIGNDGLLKLMRDIENRKARFQSVITYLSAKTESPICFGGEVAGEIVEEERRKGRESGFGFDPIFKPVNSARTFAEMDTAEKNKCSHRARALRKFAEWYGKLP
ncbi:non-canonical purine NTP pyrophosphatase, RdgB/HAM1 family [Candidatus Bathyarchaeota archaeon CG07_land_8_20_14_0_80_47_9]|nr:MAG: non-canonical purine NTP pyrophosphatase, RdgB/HAM1 family [Candidatus Bathyarchaeota archaeon CG07_land_8_20_14_0_80_47_9]